MEGVGFLVPGGGHPLPAAQRTVFAGSVAITGVSKNLAGGAFSAVKSLRVIHETPRFQPTIQTRSEILETIVTTARSLSSW
jgi:hypothetical protein